MAREDKACIADGKRKVLGWYEDLEGRSKMIGKKKKAVLY